MTSTTPTIPSPFKTSTVHGGRFADIDATLTALRQTWPDAWVEYGYNDRIDAGLARNDRADHAERMDAMIATMRASGLSVRAMRKGASRFAKVIDYTVNA